MAAIASQNFVDGSAASGSGSVPVDAGRAAVTEGPPAASLAAAAAAYLVDRRQLHDGHRRPGDQLQQPEQSPRKRERSRSPLNLVVSPGSRRSTDSTEPSPAVSDHTPSNASVPTPSGTAGLPGSAAAGTCSTKTRLREFFSVTDTSAGALEEKTRSLCSYYVSLTSSERVSFLRTLATEYGVDRHSIQQMAAQVANTLGSRRGGSTDLVTVRAAERLRQATTPRYHSLFTQISRLDNGVRFLASLRSDVIGALRSPGIDHECPQLMTLNTTLHQLLSVWLAMGNLQLERITWQTSCDLLQKISAYEAIQPIRSLTELRRRVGPYRRCYCLTHGALPREPLIVVHAALTLQISRTIQSIVGTCRPSMGSDSESVNPGDDAQTSEDPKRITTAVFYSITSTQRGLQGVELGGQVIKRIIVDLVADFPRMTQFASLSPVPGFRDWLLDEIGTYVRLREAGEEPEQLLLTTYELADLSAVFNVPEMVLFSVLRDVVSGEDWLDQTQVVSALQAPLLRLCARYLYVEKKRGYALNPVANFHLRNGAVLWRLNWLADSSPRGLAMSCTIMANYRYHLEDIDVNSRRYAENQVLAASDQVLDLVRQLPDPAAKGGAGQRRLPATATNAVVTR